LEESGDNNCNRFLPREFLKRIPGVNSHNISKLMSRVENLVELAKISEESLREIVGSRDAGAIR
jgi:ERCC4-type nuclease